MATDVGSVIGYLDLDISKFLANLKTAQSEAGNFGKNLTMKVGEGIASVGKNLTSAGSTLTKGFTVPIVGAGTAIVKTSANFESAMSKVSAISGATGSDFDKLNKKAQEMGAKTKFSATESAEAFQYMAMAGWKTTDMLDGIEGIMNLAAADGLDLATTSDIVTDAITAFGLKASDSAHFADVLAAASSNANTNVSMLGESFKYAAPVAGSLGYSAEDTAIALGLMANAGIKASQGGTALRGSLTRMVKPTKSAAVMMDKYGISMTNSDGTMKSLGEVMEMLRGKLGGLSEAEQAKAAATIFGTEAMSGMLAIINASDADYQKLTNSIYSADGAANQMAKTMLNNLNGQLTLLKSALEGLALQFGEILLPYLKKFVTFIQNLVEKLQNMSTEQKEQIAKWAAFVAAIGPALLVVGKLTTGFGNFITTIGKIPGAITTVSGGVTKLVTGFKNVGEAVTLARAGFPALAGETSKLGAAIGGITAPIAAVIAIVAVLVAAFVTLWKNNEEFRNKIKEIWDGIVDKFKEAGQKITDALNSLGFNFKDIVDVLKTAWEGFCDFIAPIFIGVFEMIATTIKGIVDVVTGVIQVVCGIIKGFKDGDWTLFLDGLETLFTGFLNIITAPFQGMFETFEGYLEKFGTTWSEVWDAIKSFFEDIWKGIVSFLSSVLTGMQDTFVSVFSAISEFFSSAWIGIKNTFEGVWNSIVLFFSEVWSTIKNIVQVGIMFIKELFNAAIEIIGAPFRFIWENCKDVIITVWEVIKEKINTALEFVKNIIMTAWNEVSSTFTTVWNAISSFVIGVWDTIKSNIEIALSVIQTAIITVWNAIKDTLQPIIDAIKNTIVTAWDAIKNTVTTIINTMKSIIITIWNEISSAISTAVNTIKNVVLNVFNAIKNTVVNIFNSIRSTAASIWNGIKDAISGPINAAKSIVSNVVDNIKSAISSGFNAAKSIVVSVFDGIKNAISNALNGAANVVRGAIDRIKGFFNFSWSLPKLKLPHPKITGEFSLNPPSVPHFSIDWYKKAMDNGMILNSPTLFGFDPKNGKFLGGGEAGSETVVGTQSLMSMIGQTVSNSLSGLADIVKSNQTQAQGDIVIPVYVGNEMLDTLVVKAINRNNYRNGGR